MLKDLIRIKGNIKKKEYTTIHDLVKQYFIMYIEDRTELGTITYRGHQLVIHDNTGFTDAMEIKEDLAFQINKIDKFEDEKVGE